MFIHTVHIHLDCEDPAYTDASVCEDTPRITHQVIFWNVRVFCIGSHHDSDIIIVDQHFLSA